MNLHRQLGNVVGGENHTLEGFFYFINKPFKIKHMRVPFQVFEVVGYGSETQCQVGENF